MSISFTKYHGTGNDFVMIDNRQGSFDKNNTAVIASMCERRFGIGADGLILLENHPDCDFNMVYYNADGKLSSMCGNGGRCIVHFAQKLGIVTNTAKFMAIDGVHEAKIDQGEISLQMANVNKMNVESDFCFLDTGSPHHVIFTRSIDAIDVKAKGAAIRYTQYGKAGANINYAEKIDDHNFKVRTYERGVEDETLSCGTGVTAVAIAAYAIGQTTAQSINLHTPGGNLSVLFKEQMQSFTNIWLKGPATAVYNGIWE